jgi:hypothetical protein
MIVAPAQAGAAVLPSRNQRFPNNRTTPAFAGVTQKGTAHHGIQGRKIRA